jgi:2-polyprenyl-6-methoxyphenol hydroxylase-like FAD-dependent oxidoreductase
MSESASPGRRRQRTAGIVGGSIAGCATAIALHRAGWSVRVFERSPGKLVDRGAGIAVTPVAIDDFIDRGLLDANTPMLHFDQFEQFWRSNGSAPCGVCPTPQPLAFRTLNWGELYRCLHSRLPAGSYRAGVTVTGITQHGEDGAALALADGSEHCFDLVICADGYRSLGRKRLFPEAGLDYAGYVGWRGMLPESALSDTGPGPLERAMTGVAWHDTLGTFYFVPGSEGTMKPGSRWVNWVLYRQIAGEELGAYMTDRSGRACFGTLPPDGMSSSRVGDLNDFAGQRLPPFFADICRRSEGSFIQAIYDTSVPAYRFGRICLAGDAGTLSRPQAASGALKAMSDAADLADALTDADDIDAALETWSTKRTAHALKLYQFGRHIAHECIDNMPDLSAMDVPAYTAWFRAANGLSGSSWQS